MSKHLSHEEFEAQHRKNLDDLAIAELARAIAMQNSPTSVLNSASTPHEIARALWLLGWRAPHEPQSDDSRPDHGR